MRPAILATVLPLLSLSCFATQRDQEALTVKTAEVERTEKSDMAAVRSDLEATRERLDNALRANADNGSDLVSEKARLNQMVGRIDELTHSIDEMKANLAAARTELDARIDELKRAQAAVPTPPPPPVVIPTDKAQHFAAIEAAYKAKDFALARTLGHEFMNRYATDDRADDVVYLMGDADLQDGHPSSALGEFNRLLKLFPKSNVLDKTLFGMGEAYFAMHDCANAKLAFQTCEAHFPKDKIGADARARIRAIEKAPPGTCAPP